MKFFIFGVFVNLMCLYVFEGYEFSDLSFSIAIYLMVWIYTVIMRYNNSYVLKKVDVYLKQKPENKVLVYSNEHLISVNDSKQDVRKKVMYVDVGDKIYCTRLFLSTIEIKEEHLKEGHFIRFFADKTPFVTISSKSKLKLGRDVFNFIANFLKYLFYFLGTFIIICGINSSYSFKEDMNLFGFSWNTYYAKYNDNITYPSYIDPVTKISTRHNVMNVLCDGNMSSSNSIGDYYTCKDNAFYNKMKADVFGEGFYKVNQNIDPGWYYYMSQSDSNILSINDNNIRIKNSASLLKLEDGDMFEIPNSDFLIRKEMFKSVSKSNSYAAADYIVGENLDPGLYEMKAFNYSYENMYNMCGLYKDSSYSLMTEQQFNEVNSGKSSEVQFNNRIYDCDTYTIELENGDYLLLENIVLKKIK